MLYSIKDIDTNMSMYRYIYIIKNKGLFAIYMTCKFSLEYIFPLDTNKVKIKRIMLKKRQII